MIRNLRLLTLAVTLVTLPLSIAIAQQAPEETAANQSDQQEVADEQESDAEEDAEEADSYELIRELIRQRKLDQAAEKLESAIQDAEDDRIHNLRDSLAQSFLITRQYKKSLEQLQASFEHRIANADSTQNQARLAMTVSLLRMAALRVGKAGVADESIDRAIEAIDGNDLGVVSMQAMATLIPQKAMHLAIRGDVAGANELLQERIDRIDSLDAGGKMKETLVTAKSKLLYAAATMPGAAEQAKQQADEFIAGAIEEFPESALILSEFARVQSAFIARSYRADPQAAKQRLERAVELLEGSVEKHRNLKMYLARLKSYEPRIQSALRLQEMVGNTAPPLEIDAWVNQGEVTEGSLAGKVVLIDFWSVWCGPCIATFPHLRDWYDEFHDQGFEIVGVTRYYGYTWDDETKRAKKSKEEIEAEDELETLAQFMQHHELRHPSIVTPTDSTMQQAFGVTGIPHAVLIDRKGIVQMIKVGSGSSNAEELHAKIQELIAE